MNMAYDETIRETLNNLIQVCLDSEQGYQQAAQLVRASDYGALFTQLAGQRHQFASELQGLVDLLGERPKTEGSVLGVVHRTWVDLRTALTQPSDEAILEECQRSEASAMTTYSAALQELLPANVREAIRRQYNALHDAYERLESFHRVEESTD